MKRVCEEGVLKGHEGGEMGKPIFHAEKRTQPLLHRDLAIICYMMSVLFWCSFISIHFNLVQGEDINFGGILLGNPDLDLTLLQLNQINCT